MKYSKKDLKIKLQGYQSLYFLTKYILGYDRMTERVHRPLCNFIQYKTGTLLDLEPRDHFKTTVASIGYSIFCIINNPNIRILLSHKILKKSKEICGEIRKHFESNETFRYFYGDWVGPYWGIDGFTVNRRTKIVREPTVTPGGTDHEITSAHYELINNDDLAGLADMFSMAAREKTVRYYKSQKFLRDRGTFLKEINMNTRWHINDYSSYIMEKRKGVHVRITKALLGEKGNYKAYFPERYTVQELLDEKEEDPIMFASQRQNDPRPTADQLYNIDQLKTFNMKSFKPVYNIGYVDPAFGKRESDEPCFFCFAIGSVVDDMIYLIEWYTNKKKPEDNDILILEKVKEHNLKMFGFESNAAQSVWGDGLKKKFKKEGIILTFKDINHTTNKDRRIQGMHGAVKNHVLFREDWEDAYPEAMSQLLLYPQHKFKDAPDGLEGVIDLSGQRRRPGIAII